MKFDIFINIADEEEIVGIYATERKKVKQSCKNTFPRKTLHMVCISFIFCDLLVHLEVVHKLHADEIGTFRSNLLVNFFMGSYIMSGLSFVTQHLKSRAPLYV